MAKDAYSKMIPYLRKNPEEIYKAWNSPSVRCCGALFAYATPSGECDRGKYGCLTTTAIGEYPPFNNAIAQLIAQHPELKIDIAGMNKNNEHEIIIEKLLPLLPVFAKCQRKIDRIFDRPAPEWRA